MENKSGRAIASKQVSIVHLIYLGIIAIIVLAFFLVFAFKTSEHAGTVVGTASTVSSLILSVIAILMTIVDSAGQRDTATQLRDAADKLQENLEKVDSSVEEIGDLKNSLLDSIGQVHKNVVDLQQGLQEVGEKHGLETNPEVIKDLEKLVNRFSKQMESIDSNNKIDKNRRKTVSYAITTKVLTDKEAYEKMKSHLKNCMEINKGYGINELYKLLSPLEYNSEGIERIIGIMLDSGFLRRENNLFYRGV